MSEWINEWNLPTSSSNSALRPSAFWDFYVKPSSRYSLVHILPTSSSKSAPMLKLVLRILYEIELLLQPRAHFATPIFQKSSERDDFVTCSSAGHSSLTVPLLPLLWLNQFAQEHLSLIESISFSVTPTYEFNDHDHNCKMGFVKTH